MTTAPPKKETVKKRGPRVFNGVLWDIATGAKALGVSEKTLRNQIARGLVPHRRLAGRIVLLAEECHEFLRRLPGVNAEEALANVAKRNGGEAAR